MNKEEYDTKLRECKNELETITQDRDYWRSTARRYKAENDELKAQLEVVSSINKSFIGEGFESLRQEMLSLVKERNLLRELISRHYRIASQWMLEAEDRFIESQELTESLEEYEKHALARAIQTAVGKTVMVAQSNLDEIECIRNGEEPKRAEDALNGAAVKFRLEGMYQILGDQLLFAYSNTWPVGLTAYKILAECRTRGRPKIETVQRLNRDWCKRNLKQNPSPELLAKGLEYVQAWRSLRNQQSHIQFALDNGLAEKTFQNYRSWYSALEKEAQNSPAWARSQVDKKVAEEGRC